MMIAEIERLFGPCGENGHNWKILPYAIHEVLRLSWTGSMTSVHGCRALCWRVFLGIISNRNKGDWPCQLQQQVDDYDSLKLQHLPSFDKVTVDPLSALSTGNDQENEWSAYYKNIELSNFIKGDLERLFLSGVDEEFFHTPERRAMLLSILFIWSAINPTISYRQGMHEILGTILFCVETESKAWADLPAEHPWANLFRPAAVEAHTYCLFQRVMAELEPIYDPVPTSFHGVENQPFVVQFCMKIQEHYLRILDPALCQHLEENFIQSQLYGLRWSRLMLGREFLVTVTHLFRLWDFMFASCYDAENNSAEELLDDDAPPNVYSVLATVRMSDYRWDTNKQRKATSMSDGNKFSYVCTPLLGSLADFMLAMLLQIRSSLIEADANGVLALLMRYPQQKDVKPLIEYADLLRRGVIIKDAHMGATLMHRTYNAITNSGSFSNHVDEFHDEHTHLKNHRVSVKINDLGKRVSAKLIAVKSAVGNSLNNIVDNLKVPPDAHTHTPTVGVLSISVESPTRGTPSRRPSGLSHSGSKVDSSARSGRPNKEYSGGAATGTGSRYTSYSPSLSAKSEDPEFDPLGVAVMFSPPPAGNGKATVTTGKGRSGSITSDSGSSSRGRYDGVVPGYVTSIVPAHTEDIRISEATVPMPERRPSYNPNPNPNHHRGSLSTFSDPLSYLSEPISYLTSAFNQVTQSGSHNIVPGSFYPSNSATANTSTGNNPMNTQIGARLLEVADMLLLMQLQSMEDLNASSSPHSTPGSSSQQPNLNISDYLQGTQQRIFEQDVRREAVRRLRMLSDVLAGSLNIDEYDARCGIALDRR